MIKKILISKYSFFILAFVYSLQGSANTSTDSIYNAIQNTNYANKYPDLKYDTYPKAKIELDTEQIEQTTEPWNFPQINGQIVWVVFICILIVGIFFIIRSNRFNLFSSKNKYSDAKILEAEKYIDELDLDYLLNQALLKGQKPEAIRFYFLKFLKTIAQKKYIKWEIQKTNNEYYYEIQNIELKKDFEYASYLYNYIWFGKFTITDEQFKSAENHFISILNRQYFYS